MSVWVYECAGWHVCPCPCVYECVSVGDGECASQWMRV